jgi:hypothetical protein
MKRGSRKPEVDEPEKKKPETKDPGIDRPGSEKTTGDTTGIDGIRALQLIAGGIAALILVWLVLHNILHIV